MANPLRLIRNPRAVLKISAKRWPANLPPPVLAMDNRNKEIAVSAMCGLMMRDGERIHCCDITESQAADIAAWLLRPAV